MKPEAATKLENTAESGVLWQSTQWYSDLPSPARLPPRYGIVTSNTSELANNVFAEARDLGWLAAAYKKILGVMSTRVCACCCKKYA